MAIQQEIMAKTKLSFQETGCEFWSNEDAASAVYSWHRWLFGIIGCCIRDDAFHYTTIFIGSRACASCRFFFIDKMFFQIALATIDRLFGSKAVSSPPQTKYRHTHPEDDTQDIVLSHLRIAKFVWIAGHCYGEDMFHRP
jgi:hypothetical protein